MKYLFLRTLNLLEKALSALLIKLRVSILKTSESTEKPNSPEEWDKMYLNKIKPYVFQSSEIGSLILKYTTKGESLLETGCGSGELSAFLSKNDRRVSICDFSEKILNQTVEKFKVTNLNLSGAYIVDITKQFPFKDNEFDVVWSSGVLEHWVDSEMLEVLKESVRVSKRCVISLIPNNKSIAYRFGRELCESYGIAPWGREMPRGSLKHLFELAGLKNIQEEVVADYMAISFISKLYPAFAEQFENWWSKLDINDEVKTSQGYLLFSVGYK
jgi:2-polyprenyl-3-methyl-5-hydroxy-6-metoxy-1,4-benzoquinol methylase